MRHPNDGTLRRLLDEPAGVAAADHDHLAGCPMCLSRLASARQDAAMAGAALRLETAIDADDVEQGWHRLSRANPQTREQMAVRPPRWRTALRSPVIAAATVVALVAGA